MDKSIKLDDKKEQSGFNKRFKRIMLVSLTVVLTCIYLFHAWDKYENIQIREGIKLSESIASLLHTDHIENINNSEKESEFESYLEESLVKLVETTDSIYYAYLLKDGEEGIKISVDSSRAEKGTSKPIKRTCEEAEDINQRAFNNKQSIITDPVTTKCGSWVRSLTPLYDEEGKEIIGVLGLNYSSKEWAREINRNMISDVLILVFIYILLYSIYLTYSKNKNLKESEREKNVILSYLPGMAYRCKNDESWTMEFVSDGVYDLTGYQVEELLLNKNISYKELISPKYMEVMEKEWERVLKQRKTYNDEYEIITKDKGIKWVMEKGQGIFDDKGNIQALEGIILDITEKKLQEYKIKDLENHDLLTGLHNRFFMEDKLVELEEKGLSSFVVLVCDIDGLAMVNDGYGHDEGDRLIKKIAGIIENSLSDEYILGHLGGGEFLIYLPYKNGQDAKKVKEKIKQNVDIYNKQEDKESYYTSVSIGYSSQQYENHNYKDLVKDAENYLRRRKLLNQHSSHSAIVSSIMASLYAKSHETEEHGQRLGEFCLMIAEKLELSQMEIDELHLLSKLHDIGKIGIDDSILNKPGKLTDAEWVIMKQHPEIGYKIAMSTPQLEHIAEFILYHHERWDGKGYPKGLSGEEIPLISRILSLADAYDAMTEDRIYRKALSKEEAIKEIDRNAGGQFDPRLAKIFIGLLTD